MDTIDQKIQQLKAEVAQLNRQLCAIPSPDRKRKVELMKAISKIDKELSNLRYQKKSTQERKDYGDSVPEIGIQQIDAILKYLPIFEQQGYQFGQWVERKGQFPYFSYSPEVDEFHRALYWQNIIIVFDWNSWGDEAQRYQSDSDALEAADLLTLRKLLTAHSRADRFVEGHLASVLENGHITAILRRLKQIRDKMVASA